MKKLNFNILLLGTLLFSCNKNIVEVEKTFFSTSFESVDDFDGFYLTPQAHKGTTYHELSSNIVHSGSFAHKSWVEGTNAPSSIGVNNNHRGYPTIQLHKTEIGSFQSPLYVTVWVWLDLALHQSITGGDDDWFSFATFTDDDSDDWNRAILVNLSHDGYVHLQHTIEAGKNEYFFQTSTIQFPQKEWVEIKIFIDFSEGKYAKVWQNGQLVSHARLGNVNNILAQAHFGMYCAPQIESGIVYNDDLRIEMVDKE